MAELGTVTRALLGIVRDGIDDRRLARRICGACVDGLDIDGAAISVLTLSSSRQTLAATDPTAELLEDLQFTLNEGACMEAATTGRAVLVPDLHDSAQTARWPLFAAAVAEQSRVGALFALPLRWGAVNLGVLDMYRVAPGALEQAQHRDALAAAETAALMLLGQRTDPTTDPTTGRSAGSDDGSGPHGVDADGSRSWSDGWLDHTVSHRAEIHQATGMVLIQLGISAADALARLRGYAFVHERLLIDVARDVVHRRLVFTRDDPP